MPFNAEVVIHGRKHVIQKVQDTSGQSVILTFKVSHNWFKEVFLGYQDETVHFRGSGAVWYHYPEVYRVRVEVGEQLALVYNAYRWYKEDVLGEKPARSR